MHKISELLLSHIVACNKATARQKFLGKRARDGSRRCGRVFLRDGFGRATDAEADACARSAIRYPASSMPTAPVEDLKEPATILPVNHVGDDGVIVGFQRGEKKRGYGRHASAEAERLRRAFERGYRGLERIDCWV